ncbi:MAG: glycosyltransferase, partial [Ignavibacteriales bacterium]|nr:glycosyltransferase [Ignavibacteriales bacterium]
DKRVLFAGYIYGEATIELMKNAYLYIQPSDVEGHSPVVLTVMGLGTPLLCSDIMENLFVVQNTALTFARGSVASLNKQMEYALLHPVEIRKLSELGKDHVLANFNWDKTADEHVTVFLNDE